MKQLILFLSIISISLFEGCAQQAESNALNQFDLGPKITFEKTMHDFGSLDFKAQAIHDFKFKNTGDAPVILSNVSSTCGCTSPSWPKNPIKPGESGVIKVQYKNTHHVRPFQKSVTVYSNGSEAPIKLTVKGNVKAQEKPVTSTSKPNAAAQ